jgi:hypothetical protein
MMDEPKITIERIPPRNHRDEITHLALIAKVDGMPPALWRTKTVVWAGVNSGGITVQAAKEQLRAEALADWANYQAAQNALKEL